MHTSEQLNTALAGRYAIERQIGAGGMATVYLARDLKHNRQVALKVLNPELGAVLGGERFMAEIEVTANLHHPNLLPLFDSGEAGGLLFYVMPYVEGETLRARLTRERQLGVDESVRIATAIANALDYAHRHHVIHRDLKPENVLMHEGQPLVMDFGIALAVSKAGGARITQTGLSLGTPQYMSPEQATGDHVLDARTDIYSLGAVLYEMLVGDPPHTGSTVQAVIAKVITEHPSSVRATRPNVPEHVEAALFTSLAKVPADRFAAASHFAAALSGQRPVTMPAGVRGTAAGPATERPAARRRSRIRETVAWVLAASAVVVAVWPSPRVPAPTLGRFLILLPESIAMSNLSRGGRMAISHDGGLIAFVGSQVARRGAGNLYLRRADEAVAPLVRGSDSAHSPSFSPDGRWLLYSASARALVKIPIGGGTPVILARSQHDSLPILGSSWGSDGRIVYAHGPELWITTAEGAEPRRLAVADATKGQRAIWQPNSLPDGRHVLVTVLPLGSISFLADSARIAVVSLDDGTVEDLGLLGYAPQFAAPGHVVFSRGAGVIYAAPFSLRRRAVTGVPARLLDGVSRSTTLSADMAVSWNGWMAYATGAERTFTTLSAVDRSGRERSLGAEPRAYADPAVSPDGSRVLLRLLSTGFDGGDLWVYEIRSGTFTRLTSDGASYRAAWSRDGARVLHLNGRADSTRIVSRPWDGSGAESVLVRRPGLAEIAPGPAHGLSAIRTLSGPRDIYLAPTDSLAAMRPFVMGPANETDPRVSPNGQWLSYTSDESGQREVYVRPIPGPGPRVPVSVGGGSHSRWSPDGQTVFYRGAVSVMAATLTERPTLAVTRRDALFPDLFGSVGDGQTWDVFPSGREFLFLRGPPAAEGRLYLLVNWQQLLATGGSAATAP